MLIDHCFAVQAGGKPIGKKDDGDTIIFYVLIHQHNDDGDSLTKGHVPRLGGGAIQVRPRTPPALWGGIRIPPPSILGG